MLDSIHHVAIICSDKDKAIDFYVNKLGFCVIRENYRADRDDWKIDLLLSGGLDGPHTELELCIDSLSLSYNCCLKPPCRRQFLFRFTVSLCLCQLNQPSCKTLVI